jgi:hypothetical protein
MAQLVAITVRPPTLHCYALHLLRDLLCCTLVCCPFAEEFLLCGNSDRRRSTFCFRSLVVDREPLQLTCSHGKTTV